MPLDSLYSRNFEDCLDDTLKRFDSLFKIKEKWTKPELEYFLSKFIDLSINFDAFLMKNTRMVRDQHPFDKASEVAYYIKKF
jgi:hypothetical protein